MDHIIPPITAELGKMWVQPNREEILIGEDTAVMTEVQFYYLLDYSNSVPSGVYPGKMWRSQHPNGDWYLCWFGVVPGDDTVCSNNSRKIVIQDWKGLMGVK